MPHVSFDLEATLPPEQVIAALTDFTPRRPELWPELDPGLYEVYSVGDRTAEIKEGSRLGPVKIWAKEHYEWSADTVTWTATEASFCKPGSRMSVSVRPRGDGGSSLHVDWDRRPISLVGRVLTALVQATHGKPLARNFERALASQAGAWSQ